MFAELLKSDVEHGLRPGVAKAENEVHNGLRFGAHTVGGEVVASRQQMAMALERARVNSARQVEAAQVLAEAMQQVLQNYSTADLRTAEQIEAIEKTLLDAIVTAKLILPAATEPHRGEFA
ncbi:hypothetical protein [Catellatospora tritici]|uniref:hypothetical protein n=1 Tax=Catellatospora tritici TaxID=2851566 RepID=UPI001C2D6270|nr:hypothetical protein [Catellatospora tritici]MBV1855289.1 hypothetical protein [Catellatospora tritici]